MENKFSVINGGLDEKLKKNEIIRIRKSEAFFRMYLRHFKPEDPDGNIIGAFAGIKYVLSERSVMEKDWWSLKNLLLVAEDATEMLSVIPLYKIIQAFPPEKMYDGEKYLYKDYFWTMDLLKKYDLSKPLGDSVEEFMFDYTNVTLQVFFAIKLSLYSELMRMQTGKGFMERIAEDAGIDLWIKDQDGKNLINKRTGESLEIGNGNRKNFEVI